PRPPTSTFPSPTLFRSGPVFVVCQVRFGGLTPHQVGERRHGQPATNRHFPPAGNRIETFRGSRQIPIPKNIDVHGLYPRSRFLIDRKSTRLNSSHQIIS